MFPIAYHTFETLEELLRFIGEEDDYRLLAGGTDLMVRYRAGKERAGKLVNLLIPELTGIRETPAELVVGASTSLTSLADAFRPLGEPFSMLGTAAESVGSCQTRNLGTVGGNLCTGNASSDMATALLAADARLTICSRGGERELPLEKFFVRNRVVSLDRGELLKEIRIPKPAAFRTAADFRKLGKRKGHVIATLNLAVVLKLDDGGLIRKARLAGGTLAPRPIRFYESEKLLADCPAEGPELLRALEQVRACLLTEIEPRDSLRGSREYRMRTAPALLSDMILEACGRGGAE